MTMDQLQEAVVRSRVRLARNVEGKAFPSKLNAVEKEQIKQQIFAVLPTGKGWEWQAYKEASDLALLNMKARGFVRPQTMDAIWIARSQDHVLSAVVCEEDHLRIQAYLPGFQLKKAHELAQQLESKLDAKLDFAFDPDFGYLTAQVANAGTGLRASILVHLPGLSLTGLMDRVSVAAGQVGLTIQPHFRSGGEATGHLYRISNQTTLGRTESELVETLQQVSYQILQREWNARETLIASRKTELLDQITRSLGTLIYARKMGLHEALDLWSNIRLGLNVNWLGNMECDQLNDILVQLSAGSLQEVAGQKLTVHELESRRASLMREQFASVLVLEE